MAQPPATTQPITNQPMPQPAIQQQPPNAYLDYLTTTNEFLIHQQIELLELVTGWESNNRYLVSTRQGQPLFHVLEWNDYFNRQMFGSQRSTILRIFDWNMIEVARIDRPLRCINCNALCCCCHFCCPGCCWCSMQLATVYHPVGQFAGSVQQKWAPFRPLYDVNDAAGNKQLSIKGPLCATDFIFTDVPFQLLDKQDVQVGQITKIWTDMLREHFSGANTFVVSFPQSLDVRLKMVLLGAGLLIDFAYFEHRHHRRRSHHHFDDD